MGYRFLDHTADLAVAITAGSLPELFAEAALAMTDGITELSAVAAREERRYEVAAAAADLLLVTWLEELLYAFEREGMLTARAEVEVRPGVAGGLALGARAWGEPFEEGRHPLKVLIKGVTYHGLEVREIGGGAYRAQLVFDI